jgi:hypothetical protein
MKKGYNILLFAFCICTSFFSYSISTAAVNVKINPSSIQLPAVGSTFQISVTINGVIDLGGVEFDIDYNPSVITIANAGHVTLGSFPGSTGRTVAILGPTINNDTGSFSAGVFSFGAQAGPNGSGTLISVTFTVQSSACSDIDLKNVMLADSSAVPIVAATLIDGCCSPGPDTDAGPDQEVDEGATVTLDGTGSTALGCAITSYHWFQTTGTPVILSDADAAMSSFTAPPVASGYETLNFDFTVTDSCGFFHTDSFTIKVNHIIQPGDLNGDGKVNLIDAMLACQILADMDITGIYISSDVNSDGRIGMEDLHYILQKTSGLR